jgi:acetyl esterase
MTKLRDRLRIGAGRLAVDSFFRGMSVLGRLHPRSDPARHGVEVVRDVPYRDTGSADHTLDIYLPPGNGPWPTVFYAHGGGFRILSKDSHWVMGLKFARRGYLVFNINYRLAPAHPFPAAVEDTCDAFAWVVEHAEQWGGDLERLVLAGESAGANLVTGLTLCLCYRRPEEAARTVFEMGVVPRAVVPACGVFQVTDPARFGLDGKLPQWVLDRLEEVTEAYLPRDVQQSTNTELADPVVVLERGEAPQRPLPPFFLPVGTNDPLQDDTRRMDRALHDLGAVSRATYYAGEFHAFHAFVHRPNARKCWSDTFAFLEEHLR